MIPNSIWKQKRLHFIPVRPMETIITPNHYLLLRRSQHDPFQLTSTFPKLYPVHFAIQSVRLPRLYTLELLNLLPNTS